MSTATVETIRDHVRSLIGDITPTVLAGDPFRDWRYEGKGDFRSVMEAQPAAAFRRYYVRNVGNDQPPEVSNTDHEERRLTLEILVSYAQNSRAGSDNAMDRDDLIESDWLQIDWLIGITGRGNFSSANDCTPLGCTKEIERDGVVDFLVIRAEFLFQRSTAGPSEEWTTDTAAGIGVPVTAAEWRAVLEAADVEGQPISIYPCQDASISLVDANGLHNLIGLNNSSYRNTIPGWTRLGAGHTYAASDNGFVKQHGNLPAPSVNSYLLMAWVIVTSDAGSDAGLLSLTDNAIAAAIRTSTRLPFISSGGVVGSQGAAALPIGTVFPIALRYDVTNSVQKFYTPYEIIGRAHTAALAAEQEVDIGVALASAVYAANANYPWASLFIGKGAEKSDEEIGRIWSTLNWDVAWYDEPQRDTGNLKYFPLTAKQWRDIDLAPPQHCWGLQETSGFVFADYIGDQMLSNSNGYANYTRVSDAATISGVTRKGVQTADTYPAQSIQNISTTMPNTSTTSMAMMVQVNVTAATTDPFPTYKNWVFGMGPNQGLSAHISSTGVWGINNEAGTSWNGAVAQLNTFAPAILVHDFANSKLVLYTLGEKITGTFAATSSGRGAMLGSTSPLVPCPQAQFAHAAVWRGADAERSDAGWRAVFTALGYTVTAW